MPRGHGPGGGGREEQRFARAVDGGVRDTTRATLERDLLVAARVRNAGEQLRPTGHERDRMRQHILTELDEASVTAPMPVPVVRAGSEARSAPASLPSRPPRGRPGKSARSRGVPVAAAAMLCLFLAISGAGLMLSGDALPGDPLYGVKRNAETAELGLTVGEEPRALKHLEFAGTRVDEIESMSAEADEQHSWNGPPHGYVGALNDFDTSVSAATRLLATMAATRDGADRLNELQRWAQEQTARLEALRAAVPVDVQPRVDASLRLLEAIEERLSQLEARLECRTITSGGSDELGLTPAETACLPPVEGAGSATPLPPTTSGTAGPDQSAPPDARPSTEAPPPTDQEERTVPTRPDELLRQPDGTDPGLPALPSSPPPPPPVLLPLPLPIPLLPGVPGF